MKRVHGDYNGHHANINNNVQTNVLDITERNTLCTASNIYLIFYFLVT